MKTNPLTLAVIVLFAVPTFAQPPGTAGSRPQRTRSSDAKLLKKFDLDENGWLDAAERKQALEFHAANQSENRRQPGRGEAPEPVEPGKRISPDEVEQYPGKDLYDQSILRTLFIDFENDDWEEQLVAFYHTDVELPATLQVDGKTYSNVGIQFRGNSSFFTVSNGRKRSMSVTLDHVNKDQDLEGYRALTLLNAHADPTFLRSILYMDMAAEYLPAPKVNYVRVVINGESWGVYINQQRFNKDFLKDAFSTKKGTRFKSSNRSQLGAFSYLGEDPDEYRKWYEIKDKDKDESWKPLINVCRVLAETPPESLESALEPIFDVDGALRFLALDIVVQSGDGYWLHGSDYNLYVDENDVLHILHHDSNEAFTAQGGSRRDEEYRPGNADVDLFVAMDDPNKALRQKLLVVPEFRRKYLEYVRDIATKSLDWERLAPKIDGFRALIAEDVAADTHKLYSLERFETSFDDGQETPSADTLKGFIQQRREFLLNHEAIKALDDNEK